MIKILFSILFAFSVAQATTIEQADYHSATSTLTLHLVYVGGLMDHKYSLLWDECQSGPGFPQIAARLIDSGWNDTGREEIRQVVSFDLSDLSCKPAQLTIFSDRYSRQTLWIK